MQVLRAERLGYPAGVRRSPAPAVALAFALGLGLAACSSDHGSSARPAQRPPTTGAPTTSTVGSPPSTTPPPPDLARVGVKLTTVVSGLDKPVALAQRKGDDTLYVAEQTGRVRRVRGGEVADTVLDLAGEVSTGNEQGLLGLAFAPDGHHVYVDYTDTGGDTHVVELTVHDDGAFDTGSRRELLLQEQPYPNHNGGEVTFGPDGMLYVGLGDGGAAGDPQGNAARLDTLLGKILRIDPRPSGDRPYSVPVDNPFVDDPAARPEIWMYGLRNPWRFSFDRVTHDLWIGDVGQNAWEEIDFLPAGRSGVDFGWNAREGTHEYSGPRPEGAVDPIFEYSHAEGGVSVTGGFVYRGSRIPGLVGAYLFADYAGGDLVALVERDGRLADRRELGVDGGLVSSFAEDHDGELYVLDLGGTIHRLDPA